jgi:hypothetical protein
MKTLLEQVVFSVGGSDYVWKDVVQAGERWGDWDRLCGRAKEDIACLARLDDEAEEPLTTEEVESAANEFRYARDLVSAEETERWLEKWGLTVESWMDWIRSSLLRRKWSGQMPDLLSEYPAADEDLERLLQAEAVCSGDLARLAYELAGRAAIREKENERLKAKNSDREGGNPEPHESGDPSDGFARLEESFRRFRDRVLSPEAIQGEIRSRQADWTQVDCELVSFPAEEAAREAALCVTQDGETLSRVAGEADRGLRRERFYVEDAAPALRDRFLGARKGELLGPLEVEGEFVLCRVVDKVLPSKRDPALVARARETVVKRLVDQEIVDRVTWHWPL